MSNDKKAKEIAEQTLGEFAPSFLGYINEMTAIFCEDSARKMAEHKDGQLRDYLEDELKAAKDARKKCRREAYLKGRRDAVKDIIKGLYKAGILSYDNPYANDFSD